MQTISTSQLETVTGGAQGDNGRACFDLNNPPAGTQMLSNPSPPNQMAQSVERYNKFYDNYTGLIDNLNGIGGGAAVMGGAKPTPDIGF
ncbi:MAG TPA: hypothetical protein VGF94_07415 [Kofleriaceae bacterium]|jgi:hypothetical protein